MRSSTLFFSVFSFFSIFFFFLYLFYFRLIHHRASVLAKYLVGKKIIIWLRFFKSSASTPRHYVTTKIFAGYSFSNESYLLMVNPKFWAFSCLNSGSTPGANTFRWPCRTTTLFSPFHYCLVHPLLFTHLVNMFLPHLWKIPLLFKEILS